MAKIFTTIIIIIDSCILWSCPWAIGYSRNLEFLLNLPSQKYVIRNA